jgi:hypothetical protein
LRRAGRRCAFQGVEHQWRGHTVFNRVPLALLERAVRPTDRLLFA